MSKSGVKAPSQRQLRVGEQIKHLIAGMLLREKNFFKPKIDFALITVTDVNIGPDLKNAKIYVASSKDVNIRDLIASLDHIAYLFKREIGKALNLRYVPKLNFYNDNTLNEVERIQSLLSHKKVQDDLDKEESE